MELTPPLVWSLLARRVTEGSPATLLGVLCNHSLAVLALRLVEDDASSASLHEHTPDLIALELAAREFAAQSAPMRCLPSVVEWADAPTAAVSSAFARIVEGLREAVTAPTGAASFRSRRSSSGADRVLGGGDDGSFRNSLDSLQAAWNATPLVVARRLSASPTDLGAGTAPSAAARHSVLHLRGCGMVEEDGEEAGAATSAPHPHSPTAAVSASAIRGSKPLQWDALASVIRSRVGLGVGARVAAGSPPAASASPPAVGVQAPVASFLNVGGSFLTGSPAAASAPQPSLFSNSSPSVGPARYAGWCTSDAGGLGAPTPRSHGWASQCIDASSPPDPGATPLQVLAARLGGDDVTVGSGTPTALARGRSVGCHPTLRDALAWSSGGGGEGGASAPSSAGGSYAAASAVAAGGRKRGHTLPLPFDPAGPASLPPWQQLTTPMGQRANADAEVVVPHPQAQFTLKQQQHIHQQYHQYSQQRQQQSLSSSSLGSSSRFSFSGERDGAPAAAAAASSSFYSMDDVGTTSLPSSRAAACSSGGAHGLWGAESPFAHAYPSAAAAPSLSLYGRGSDVSGTAGSSMEESAGVPTVAAPLPLGHNPHSFATAPPAWPWSSSAAFPAAATAGGGGAPAAWVGVDIVGNVPLASSAMMMPGPAASAPGLCDHPSLVTSTLTSVDHHHHQQQQQHPMVFASPSSASSSSSASPHQNLYGPSPFRHSAFSSPRKEGGAPAAGAAAGGWGGSSRGSGGLYGGGATTGVGWGGGSAYLSTSAHASYMSPDSVNAVQYRHAQAQQQAQHHQQTQQQQQEQAQLMQTSQ